MGLRPSPTLLMLTLYKILVEDAENDPADQKQMKSSIYDLTYMDNACITCNNEEELQDHYEKLPIVANSNAILFRKISFS